MIPCAESNGIGASLMPVVCAWCGAKKGAKVCENWDGRSVSHGMCRPCAVRNMAALPRVMISSDAASRRACMGLPGATWSGAPTVRRDNASGLTGGMGGN